MADLTHHQRQPHAPTTRGFVLEDNVYLKYMSHPRGNGFPTPVWCLSDETVSKLKHKYIICEDKTPEEMRDLMKKSLDDNLDSIALKKGFTFKVPKSEIGLMQYEERTCIPLLSCGDKDYITRSFTDGRTRHAATKTAWAVQKLCANLDAGVSITKRDLMYENRELFENQHSSDRILTDLCSMYRCRMSSLNVLPLQKGIVLGNIIIKLRNGLELNCSEGAFIPNDLRRIQDIVLIEGAEEIEYVLVVEKYTMLHYLEQMKFHNRNYCIILTGCGMPDLPTRGFLRLLKNITQLPMYGISDPDPHGAAIIATYARGSVESAYDNFNLAVPTLQWIGLWISELINLPEVPQHCLKSFNNTDRSKLEYLLNVKNIKLSEGWLHKIEEMKEIGKKASFEDVKYMGLSYFADELLPKLIKHAAASH